MSVSVHQAASGLFFFILTFNPYCNLAIIGLSDMKVKRPRLMLNGNGMMRLINTTISKTRRAKTWRCACQLVPLLLGHLEPLRLVHRSSWAYLRLVVVVDWVRWMGRCRNVREAEELDLEEGKTYETVIERHGCGCSLFDARGSSQGWEAP